MENNINQTKLLQDVEEEILQDINGGSLSLRDLWEIGVGGGSALGWMGPLFGTPGVSDPSYPGHTCTWH